MGSDRFQRSQGVQLPSRGRLVRRVSRAVLGFGLAAGLALGACGGSEDAACEGETVDGQCQKKCDPTQCVDPAMKCVSNTCNYPCQSLEDCPAGKYCYGTVTNDGIQGQFCDLAPFAKNGGGTGQYEPCAADTECDELRGYKCLSGECRKTPCATNADCYGIGVCNATASPPYCDNTKVVHGPFETCTTTNDCDTDVGLSCVDGECRWVGCKIHNDCVGIGLCVEGKDDAGKTVLACAKGTTYPAGQFGTGCPGGTDAKECDEANKFVCVGAGPADADAYCTMTGCIADADCATGYYCAQVRTSRPPCTDACGLQGNSSVTTCVKSADIGQGKEYSCGPITLLRNLCLKREYCSECETNEDCRGVQDQICAKDMNGNKHCTVICDQQVMNACPWGNASECKVWDQELGVPTCAHRFGACKGTGKGCEPCVDDSDCPTGLCIDSSFTRERYCVDLDAACSCSGLPTEQNVYCSGGGCPQTPGGLTMHCYGGSAVQSAGSPLYDTCVGADVSMTGSPQTGCWPAL